MLLAHKPTERFPSLSGMVLTSFLLLSGCGPVLRFPGPLGPLGKPLPEVVELAPTPDAPPAAVVEIDRGATDHPDRVASAARYYLTHDLDGFRDDCSGFVSAVMTRAGLPMELGAIGLWEAASGAGATHHRKIPRVGDIAFFDNTYDRNKDRKPNDIATHVAVVIGVADDGTITMAHGGSSHGRTTLTMNLLRPHDRRAEDGTELNDYLRVRKDSDPAGLDYLAGELWRGFATVREVDLADWIPVGT